MESIRSRTLHSSSWVTCRSHADPPRIQQVLLNMLSNAVLHGDRNSVVSLNARGRNRCRGADGCQLRPAEFRDDVLQMLFEPLVHVPPGNG